MSLKPGDLKKLWAKSGNMCAFPGCSVKLAPEKKGNRVMGEEAHIKGENPGAARFDPNQSVEERGSCENRILLCPNHHTMIDVDEDTYTVESLLQMKEKHERQVERNWRHPEVMDELARILKEYQASEESLVVDVAEVIEGPTERITIGVGASQEGGVNTHIRVSRGQRIAFFARGLVSFDGRRNFATPEGILCNEYGLPLAFKDGSGKQGWAVWPHPGAYKTDGGQMGRIGSLMGWINSYDEGKAFLVGTKREIEVAEEGVLYLAVNDAKGTYGDNDGEFRVDVRIMDADV